jgi:hypothetical protein
MAENYTPPDEDAFQEEEEIDDAVCSCTVSEQKVYH